MHKLSFTKEMPLIPSLDFSLFDNFPKNEKEILFSIFTNLELSVLDYLTLRDLCELSGYKKEMPFIVILMLMLQALEEGSLCLNLSMESIKRKLKNHLETDIIKKILNSFLLKLEKGELSQLIGLHPDDFLPLVMDVQRHKKLLYFQKFYFHEQRLKKRIHDLIKTGVYEKEIPKQYQWLIDEVFSDPFVIRISIGGRPIIKDPFQLKAIQLVLRSHFSIISGGPGTGKTSLFINIMRCCIKTGIRPDQILLCAPTGRAAQRMTESIQYHINTIRNPTKDDIELIKLKASTIHKLLKFNRFKNTFHFTNANPFKASLIIMDEVSMVDVVMMDRFLQAVDTKQTKLVFLGDKNQLPSVNAGAVLAGMIPEETVHDLQDSRFNNRLVILKNVFRSGHHLVKLAEKINMGQYPKGPVLPFERIFHLKDDQWAFVKPCGPAEWMEYIHLWVRYYYCKARPLVDKSYLELIKSAEKISGKNLVSASNGQSIIQNIFTTIGHARILTLVRYGIFGTTAINHLVGQILCSQLKTPFLSSTDAFSGAIIMINRNEYSKSLYNGDIGVVIKDKNNNHRAYFQQNGAFSSFSIDQLPSWGYAFSMTVHKSQGSEFDDVLLVLPEDENHRLLTREIIYTGITRAKKRAVIFGSKSALNRALNNKIHRESGLVWEN